MTAATDAAETIERPTMSELTDQWVSHAPEVIGEYRAHVAECADTCGEVDSTDWFLTVLDAADRLELTREETAILLSHDRQIGEFEQETALLGDFFGRLFFAIDRAPKDATLGGLLYVMADLTFGTEHGEAFVTDLIEDVRSATPSAD